jgi:type III pantothenate kinase
LNQDKRVCTVAVDVGNTAVKLAVRHQDTIVHRAIPIDSDCWATEAIGWASEQLGCRQIRWIVSSVHRSAAEKLIDSINDRPGRSDFVQIIRHQDVPMPVRVDQPASLGIDRLLSAFAAVNLPTTDPVPDGLVVIDAGSAITVDWVDAEGCFRGGAILPGLRLQAKSLATGTDALPEIDWTADQKAILPGTNTRDAIYGGILLGTCGAIDALAARYLGRSFANKDFDHQKKIVLAGGDAMAISAQLQCPHQCLPHLVCHGLLQLDD